MDTSRKRRNHIIDSASLELSPSAELIANNIDLLTQILLCFPAKSLIRFKSVSKLWLSLISDSQFSANHSRRNPRPSVSGLFLRNGKTGNTECFSLQGRENRFTLAFLNCIGVAQRRPEITHSCNGLLLCKYGNSALWADPDHFLVCNPTTKTRKLIPHPPGFSSWCVPRSSRAFLAFNPSKSSRYRVVFLGTCYSCYPEKSYIYIYRSESASWKQFCVPDGLRIRRDRLSITHEAFCGGVFYWLCDVVDAVVVFDVDSEEMKEVPNPPRIRRWDKIRYFGECDGRLILIQTDSTSIVECRILEMDKDYSRWIVKSHVNLGPLLSMKSGLWRCCILKEDKEKDFELVFAYAGKVISYNLMSQTWNVLYSLVPGEPVNIYSWAFSAYKYVESLSPL